MPMTLDQFREDHGGAPVEEHEFAARVVQHLAEGEPLRDAAQAYLDALEEFRTAMADADVELG